jgi:DNA-binding SARP family transcriptional activator
VASLRILGPIEAWTGDRRLDAGGPRQLALLAYLLLNANRAVPTDVLIETLWGSSRSGSDNRLQMAVARLRRALAPLEETAAVRLRTVSGGYLLAVASAELDTEVFTRQVHDGLTALEAREAPAAHAALAQALALWRGPPLAEVSFEDFAQPEIRRLEETRLVALEGRIEADLQLGRHGALVGELEGLLAEHPSRERVAGQLMLALYRGGRQHEALETYQRTRVHLAEQLGLEPGPALKTLQAQILEQAPSLAATPDGRPPRPSTGPGPAPAVSATESAPADFASSRGSPPLPSRLEPHGPPVFVNRQTERAALRAALEEVVASGRRAAFITGDPGIGKTRLVSEVAREAHASGTMVLAGRCDEGFDLPYQPFVEALEELVEHASTELLEEHVARYGDSLSRLVPGVTRGTPESWAGLAPPSESERYVLFRAVEGLLDEACATGPVLLVLEDLHWADAPTLRLLWRLLSSPRRAPLMLLATCRATELPDDHPLRELLADVHRESNVIRLELSGLRSSDVVELVGAIGNGSADTADEQLVRALEVSTDGNPFFITELTRSLLETGALSSTDGRWHMTDGAEISAHLPLSISETLAARVRRMGDDVRRCLRVAAVIGEQFDLDLVAELAELSDAGAAADALDLAVRRSVLLDVPDRPGRFRFVHVLMQRYLYRQLGSARRIEMHRRVAEAMEDRSEDGRWSSAELARQWAAAGDAQVTKARRYAAMAGDDALAKLAPDEARRWYELALELLGRRPGFAPSELMELLLRRGDAERQAGDRRFRETLLEAAELAQRIGDDDGLVRAALANTRGMQSQTGIVDDVRIATLRAALRTVGDGDSPERARLLAMHAAELMYSQDWEGRIDLSDQALAIARRLQDPQTLTTVLNMRFVTLLAPDTHEERLANTLEALAAAERLAHPIAQFYAYHWRGYACIEAGDLPAARTWLAREREFAERFRQPTALWLSRADEANLAIVAGELEAADRLGADALEIGRAGEPDALACFAAQRTSIAFALGRLGELVPMLAETVSGNPGVPGFRATLALAQAEGGRRDEAAAALSRAQAVNFSDLPRDVTWLAVMCIYAQVAFRLELGAAANAVYDLLAPYEQQIAFPAFGVWGPVALHLGALALCTGDLDRAQCHLAYATDLAERAGAPLWRDWARDLTGRLPEISQ